MNQKEIEQHLFKLLSVADAQQRAAIEAVSGLVQERQNLARERAELKSTIDIGIHNAVLKYSPGEAAKGSRTAQGGWYHYGMTVMVSLVVTIWCHLLLQWVVPPKVVPNFDQEALIQRLRQEQLLPNRQEPATPTKTKNKR